MVFKSDLNFQIEAFKRCLKYHRVLRLLLIVELLFFYSSCIFIAYQNYLKFGVLYGIYWVIIVPIVPHITPKTYKTHLRGLFINGHLYKWRNFSSYFTDDRFLYLLGKFGRWEIVKVVLPREFEQVVGEFVRRICN